MQVLEPNTSTFGSRLVELIDSNGLTRTGLAQELGVSKNTVLTAARDETYPRLDVLLKLHGLIPEADLHYLLTGERRFGESRTDLLRETQAEYGVSQKIKLRVYVANAGDTIELESYEDFFDLDIVTDYPTPEEWGRACFYVQGDSMSPTLEQGEVVMGNRVNDPAEYEDGGVYMIQTGGQLLCKRVYLDENDKTLLVLVSDNTVHRDKRVERDGARLWKLKHRITGKGLGGL